jgi:hypothetical protein
MANKKENATKVPIMRGGGPVPASSGFVGYKPNPEVQQTSDYRSKERFHYILNRFPEVSDTRHKRVPRPYR